MCVEMLSGEQGEERGKHERKKVFLITVSTQGRAMVFIRFGFHWA